MIADLTMLAWPRRGRSLTILTYHRVLPEEDPLRLGEVVAEAFGRQMEFLAKNFAVLPLQEAVRCLQRGKLPARACCITFDDGYADNLTVAQPILAKHGLPATVFVASGYLDGGRMFSDAVTDAIAAAQGETLDLAGFGLRELPMTNVDQRRLAVRAVQEYLKYLPPAERDQKLAALLQAAGCTSLPTNLMLTSSQVRELSRKGIEIGAHTVAHTILTTLDADSVARELRQSKEHLEAITGKPILSFAYPNGRPGRDFAREHVALVRQAGFRIAVTTAAGVGVAGSDVLQLPRIALWGTSPVKWGVRMVRNAWATRPLATC